MTGQADRIEALIRSRIEQNRYDRNDVLRLAGARFKPLRLAGTAAAVGRDYQRQTWSVGELLRFYDRQFVQNAYLVLLKRDADVEGLNARLEMLHTGQTSRLELLFRLRYGAEGKQHGTVVKGLLRAFAIERLCRVPVVGVLPRYLRALLYLPRLQRDIEQLRGLVAMQKNEADDRNQAIVDFQNEHFAKIIRHLNP
jgi:O-antigen chain-terminating methyltransferase